MGKATLTSDSDEVDEEQGIFLKKSQSVLASFLQLPVRASLSLQEYCLEFWSTRSDKECFRLLDEDTLPEDLSRSSMWLARRL